MPEFHSYSFSVLSSELFSALFAMIFVQCDFFQLYVFIYDLFVLFYVCDVYDSVFSPPHYFIFVTVLSYFYELYFIWDSTVGVVTRPQAG